MMTQEYISREDALNFETKTTAAPSEIQAISKGMALYAEHIKAIPAADVVPVVRCRNCKFFREHPVQFLAGDFGLCGAPMGVKNTEVITEKDGYCSGAMPKDADERESDDDDRISKKTLKKEILRLYAENKPSAKINGTNAYNFGYMMFLSGISTALKALALRLRIDITEKEWEDSTCTKTES